MLDHLITDANEIIFTETVTNVDGEDICSFVIGKGYGVFGGLSTAEMSLYRDNNYRSFGVVVHYKEIFNPDITIDGKVYKQESTVPTLKQSRRHYQCTWHGQIYDISGVSPKYDIDGNFVGYRIYSSNE